MITERARLLVIATVGALCLTVTAGCRADRTATDWVRVVAEQCHAETVNDFYFPAGSFSTVEASGSALQYEYGSYLAAAGEPSLSCGPGPDEAYRLVWVHALRPDPIVISISRTAGRYTVTTHRLDAADEDAVAVDAHGQKMLTADQWQNLRTAAEQAEFFSQPMWHHRLPFDPMVLDADNWVLEGRDGSSYHAILRGSFEERSDAFDDFCRLFFELAGVDLPSELQSAPILW